MSGRHHESSSAQQAVDAPPHAGSASDHANTTEARAVRRDSRARRKNTLEDGSSSADNATVAASLTSLTRTKSKDAGEAKSRPIRIRYETPTRGLGGGKREISHASLGKLVARLTDAHQYDTEFRDVFLLTYRGFCTPYDFIKKLMKRYTAVLTLCSGLDAETLKETQILLDQIAREEEDERGSMISAISTAKSDINTGMEASVSIMRLLSVLKYWIKESTFIDMDLQNDRRAQKKLMGFLAEIQSSSPIGSIRKHAENMLLVVAQLIRQQQIQLHQQQQLMASQVALPPAPVTTSMAVPVPTMQASYAPTPTGIPPPPKLTTSASVSSISDSATGTRARMMPSTDISQGRLTAAMSKLKLSRSSSDPKRERSMVKLKTKQSSGDIFQLRTRSTEEVSPNQSQSRHSPTIMATTVPKMMRGVTTGSAEMEALRPAAGPNSPGLEDVIQDTLQRARMTAAGRSSSRTSYDNVEPLSGISAQEMADQLTLMEAENYFAKLNPRELTNKAWTRETKHKDAPNVMALIELFDSTAEWVSSEILHPQLQAVERAKIITLFIDTADNCQQMNNFNTMFEIATGLSAPCIRQLSTTWGLVGANALEKYQCLQQICSPEDNYRNYRQAYALAEGQPRLACWFILVKDLFTFEEAMKSIEDGLVNWQKFRKIYRVINEALDRQNFTYLPVDGSSSTGISRKGKGILRHDRRVTMLLRHRVDTYVTTPLLCLKQLHSPHALLSTGSARTRRCCTNWRAMPIRRRVFCLSIVCRKPGSSKSSSKVATSQRPAHSSLPKKLHAGRKRCKPCAPIYYYHSAPTPLSSFSVSTGNTPLPANYSLPHLARELSRWTAQSRLPPLLPPCPRHCPAPRCHRCCCSGGLRRMTLRLRAWLGRRAHCVAAG